MAKEFNKPPPGQPSNAHILTDVALYASPFAALFFLGVNVVRLRLFEWRGLIFLVRHGGNTESNREPSKPLSESIIEQSH